MGQGKKRVSGKNPKMPSIPHLNNHTILDENGQVTFCVKSDVNAFWFRHNTQQVIWRMPYITTATDDQVTLSETSLEQMLAHLTVQHKTCIHRFRRCAASHCVVPVKSANHTCNLLDFVNMMLAKDYNPSTTRAGQSSRTTQP